MIDCPEAVRRMWAYIDHALDRGPTEEFETHLEACQRCCGELEFSRHLRGMVATTGSETLPPALRDRLESILGLPDTGPDASALHD